MQMIKQKNSPNGNKKNHIAITLLMHDNFFTAKTLFVIKTLSNIYFMAIEEEHNVKLFATGRKSSCHTIV